MESPRKFNDCYFYYYSTCTKGDNCVFRHEPSALGCETMCTAWQQGKCLDKHCKLRHMELRKNRKQIPCYWETQPGGCRKKHCPFMHKNPEARTDGIAPSQSAPPVTATATSATTVPTEVCPGEQPVAVLPPTLPAAVPAPVPAPHQTAVPLLWQQQRQVVLDSTILGVLPASADIGRRVMPQPHEAPNPYGQLPVDPLVVNFEEESDNESAPSSTPTKDVASEEAQRIARSKSQELLLLEKIQAEAAAFYCYDNLPVVDMAKERKIVRTNLSTKYDKLSLDELSGKTPTTSERLKSVDFKVLSLDEIRAKKKATETIVHTQPITLNLNRKRTLSSTQEINTTSGNKIIKVVRSNSIVYKKVDPASSVTQNKASPDTKFDNRKRTVSEISDDVQENELIDNCYEFKKIKLTETTSKPKLIRNRCNSDKKDEDVVECSKNTDNDSDNEVQILDVSHDTSIGKSDCEIVEESIDIVELSDEDESDIYGSDLDLVTTNVPDIVASCQKNSVGDLNEKDVIHDIDALLDDDEDL